MRKCLPIGAAVLALAVGPSIGMGTTPQPEEKPTPAPAPSTPEVVPVETTPQPPPPVVITPPIVIVPPPTCAELIARYPKAGKKRQRDWGCLALPRPDKPPRASSIRYYPCPRIGARSKVVITVTTSTGKTGRVVRWGKICKSPAVTG